MNSAQSLDFAKRCLIATLVVVGTSLILYLAYLARVPLLWIGIAAFLAVAINPLVHRLARYMPRRSVALATLVVLVIFVAVLGFIAWLFVAPLVDQSVKLVSNLPAELTKVANQFSHTPLGHTIKVDPQAITQFVHNNANNLMNSVSFLSGIVVGTVLGIVNFVIAVVAIMSLIFFMSSEEQRWKRSTLRLIPANQRDKAARVGRQVYHIVNGYVMGNVLLSLIFGVVGTLLLWVTKSPYFLPLGLAVGFLDLIPLVGSSIAAILVALVSLLIGQPWVALIFIVFTIIYVQLENNVLNPMVYSKNVDVSPLIVLASILIGGAAAGIIGALVAIPVAATLQVVVRELLAGRA